MNAIDRERLLTISEIRNLVNFLGMINISDRTRRILRGICEEYLAQEVATLQITEPQILDREQRLIALAKMLQDMGGKL